MSDPTRLSPSMTHAHSDRRLPLDAIFSPRAVAVIGATEKTGSVGRPSSGT